MSPPHRTTTQKLTCARVQLLLMQPFFGTLCLRLKLTESVLSTFHIFGVACQTIAAASRVIDLMPGNDQWIISR